MGPIFRAEVACPMHPADRLAEVHNILSARGAEAVEESVVSFGGIVRVAGDIPAAAALGLDTAIGSPAHCHAAFARWSCVPGNPTCPGRHRDLVLGLRQWRQLQIVVPLPEEILGVAARLTPAEIFSDDLLDIAVPFAAL